MYQKHELKNKKQREIIQEKREGRTKISKKTPGNTQ